jgi:phage gp29-like protein
MATILQSIADVINTDAIPRLLRVNGMPVDNCPRLVFDDIETPDLEGLGKYINDLTSSGMAVWPNAALESYLLRSANLPEPTEEERATQEMDAAAEEDAAPVDEGEME